jgi:hypothetical protein
MPSVDADAILLSIRIASYGSEMDFDTVCPGCKEESSFSLNVGVLVEQIAMPDYGQLLEVDGLRIKIRPQNYNEVNHANQITFTEQQILRTVDNDGISDEDKKRITDAYLSKLIDLNIEICANSTEAIITEDGITVSEPGFIKEFYEQADFKIMRTIQDHLKELGKQTELKPVPVACKHCENKYEVPLTFDYANFFA